MLCMGTKKKYSSSHIWSYLNVVILLLTATNAKIPTLAEGISF